MPRTLEYDVVDVFTSRAFAGNPLAVVHGAQGLTDEQLHSIAVEFNLSETTFPLAPRAGGDYGVRIFTIGGEVPFAGHPTIGTAWVLRDRGLLGPGAVVQECGVGPVRISLPEDPAGVVELETAPRDPPAELDPQPYASALGLSAGDVCGPVLAAGCGLTFVHVPVSSDALARARCPRPGDPCLHDLDGGSDPLGGVDVYTIESQGPGPLALRCRVFCPELVEAEDPATGSSALGLGLAAHARGLLPASGRYVVSQGVEMGRPSQLSGRLVVDGERVTMCTVAGGVVSVASGRIAVPDR